VGGANPGDSVRVVTDRVGWRPGLDGLRALAVTFVVAYHMAPDDFRGGFLGVSVFFTLSGYLITALLLEETRNEGRISLSAFWIRRIRRLWPLSWATFGAVGLAGAFGIWGSGAGNRLGAELAASMGQVMNWWQMGHQGYVNLFGRASPLRHIWSLSIEEQFYVVWPLAVWLFARRGRSLSVVLAAGIGASALATLAASGNPDQVYLSTATRSAELLAGAALALAWRNHPLGGLASVRGRVTLSLASVAAASIIGLAMLRLRPDDAIWGRGGFFLIAICSTVLVATAVTDGPIATALSWTPLAWLGRRSYAIYLVHWPLWVALPIGWPFVTRVGLTVSVSLLAAEALHRFLEKPVRERSVAPPVLVSMGAVVVLAIGLGSLLARSGGGAESALAVTLGRVSDPTITPVQPAAPADDTTTTTTTPCTPTSPGPATLDSYGQTLAGGSDPTIDPCASATKVLVLGDSTARGLANGLRALGDPKLLVWDRSVLSCSLGGEAKCPDWRQTWPHAVQEIRPDIVLVDMIPITTLDGVDSSNVIYLSEDEKQRRTNVLTAAMQSLKIVGGNVVWMRSPHLHARGALLLQGALGWQHVRSGMGGSVERVGGRGHCSDRKQRVRRLGMADCTTRSCSRPTGRDPLHRPRTGRLLGLDGPSAHSPRPDIPVRRLGARVGVLGARTASKVIGRGVGPRCARCRWKFDGPS